MAEDELAQEEELMSEARCRAALTYLFHLCTSISLVRMQSKKRFYSQEQWSSSQFAAITLNRKLLVLWPNK
eukprot:2321051-Amphidinium_carterae.1